MSNNFLVISYYYSYFTKLHSVNIHKQANLLQRVCIHTVSYILIYDLVCYSWNSTVHRSSSQHVLFKTDFTVKDYFTMLFNEADSKQIISEQIHTQ